MFCYCKGPSIKKAAKGKLLDCFNNKRREYKKAGLIVSTKPRSPDITYTSTSHTVLNQTAINAGIYNYLVVLCKIIIFLCLHSCVNSNINIYKYIQIFLIFFKYQ